MDEVFQLVFLKDLPYLLDSKSECPPLFNCTTRLYYFPVSPYSQCVKIALNYKGLDEIECLPISLNDKPTWYVEKVYPVGKVPALEHNGKVKGESLDLLVYIDQEFGGPNMTPTICIPNFIYLFMLRLLNEFCKLEFSYLSCTKIFVVMHNNTNIQSLGKCIRNYANEGPFILGKFSMVDIAYVPFIERAEISFSNANYDIMAGRPKLAKWIEAMNTIDAYTSTKLETIGAVYIWEAIVVSC
ncbi:unnamed protein product [Sphagnum jensenii]|uniref:GST N-terminal domain-containing protein n=1 Tax=Sphagnum jensenii TaxID=128206 RepID=A0ABP1BRJ5_9BRYO